MRNAVSGEVSSPAEELWRKNAAWRFHLFPRAHLYAPKESKRGVVAMGSSREYGLERPTPATLQVSWRAGTKLRLHSDAIEAIRSDDSCIGQSNLSAISGIR